jgi:transcription elongation GreA/GreB family factor
MSSAFLREQDDVTRETIADRPVSPQRNLVTPEGFAKIEAAIAAHTVELEQATKAEDLHAQALAQRELRYWSARRASAEIVHPIADKSHVRFGHTVSLKLASGEERTYRLVGEDEADPAKGLLPHVAPLAQALLGKSVGDKLDAIHRKAKIIAIA